VWTALTRLSMSGRRHLAAEPNPVFPASCIPQGGPYIEMLAVTLPGGATYTAELKKMERLLRELRALGTGLLTCPAGHRLKAPYDLAGIRKI
jgi:hypothetical protein